MITTRLSKHSMAEMEICLRQAVEKHGCSVVRAFDLCAKLYERRVQERPEVRVYEICDPIGYSTLFERQPALASLLPLRIAVRPAAEGVELSAISLSNLLRSTKIRDLMPLIEEMEMAVQEIMIDAARWPYPHPQPAPHGPDPFDHEGATDAEMSVTAQIPQRIDAKGTKVEELAGTGRHDSSGG